MNEQRNEPHYREWVLPNWTSFLPLLLIYPTFWLTFVPIDETLGVLLGVGLTLIFAGLMFAKAARIRVTDDELLVGRAVLERRYIGEVTVIGESEAFAARGRELNPAAWVHFQGSVKTLVKVWVIDPQDPTPYWLFSTRHPDELVRALSY